MAKKTEKVETGKGMELSPATINQMPIQQQMADYQTLLKNQADTATQVEEKVAALRTLLSDANFSYSEDYKKDSLVIYKKAKEKEALDEIADEFGEYFADALSDLSTKKKSKLKKFLGDDAFAKIEQIVDVYHEEDVKEKDTTAMKTLADAYFPLVKELKDLRAKADLLSKQKDNAKEFISYVSDLAKIASVTRGEKE